MVPLEHVQDAETHMKLVLGRALTEEEKTELCNQVELNWELYHLGTFRRFDPHDVCIAGVYGAGITFQNCQHCGRDIKVEEYQRHLDGCRGSSTEN